MPRLLLLLAVAVAGLQAGEALRPATPDEIALLQEAVKNNHQDTEHWAYTETTLIEASLGRPQGVTVVRFDPSKPYAEQFTPLQINGRLPTEKQLRQYRERGEKRGEKLARDIERTRNALSAPPQLRISGSKANLDLAHPQVVQTEPAAPDRLTFEIPIQGTRRDIPVEKFQVRMLVNKNARQVETVTLLLRESFRMKLVAKVKAGAARMDFTVVDPHYAPVITSIKGNFGGSVLFIPVDATFTNTRTEWRRVKAHDERFTVKLAPMQLLDF